jgi:cystathionine beta-synthase
MARYLNTVLDAIGETPLIRLNRVGAGTKAVLYGKLESVNPGGSFKDRIGVSMIEAAEKDGRLKPGGTIVEATAGNTGVGLAQAAAVKGYRCIFVLPDKMSEEKIALLKAYGAEVVVTKTVPKDDPENYHNVAQRIAHEIPGAWFSDQFANPDNPIAHYRTTGPEIWRDTDGKIDVFVAGMGTTGSISGTARYLKEKNPGVVIVGADPEGSVLSGDTPRPYKVEGIGVDYIPKIFRRDLIDEIVRIGDKESFNVARRLAREEGILVGGSAGTAVAAALRYAQRLTEPKLIVVFLCDTGRNYISKVFSDRWMQENGLWEQPAGGRVTVAHILPEKAGIPPIVAVRPDAPIAGALDAMNRYNISQVPVIEGSRVVGTLEEMAMMKLIHDGVDPANQPASPVMGPPLPQVDADAEVTELYRMLLAEPGAAVVMQSGRPHAVLTRIDLIHFYARRSHEVRDEGDPRRPGA